LKKREKQRRDITKPWRMKKNSNKRRNKKVKKHKRRKKMK